MVIFLGYGNVNDNTFFKKDLFESTHERTHERGRWRGSRRERIHKQTPC